MRVSLLFTIAALLLLFQFTVATDSSVEWVDVSPSTGYIPSSDPSSSPGIASLLAPIPTIPSDPECSPRPQTIAEAMRYRHDAAKLGHAIDVEVKIMRKRKQFVSQMTAYLNDRILELNKVKNELAEEMRWIGTTQHKIQELAEREKLVKLQDVLQCVNAGKAALDSQSSMKSATVTGLTAKAEELQASVKAIQDKITSIETGTAAAKASY